jgi:hypothetical protein
MATFNHGFAQQLPNIFPVDHKDFSECATITKAHIKSDNIYGAHLKDQKEVYGAFRAWYDKFIALSTKVRNRDKAQDKFRHYYEKVAKLRKERLQKQNSVPGYPESKQATQEAEIVARVSSSRNIICIIIVVY